MTAPRVSVLMPVRDAAATLGQALGTIARQSEPGFECVVVDDGSRDESLAIARAFAAKDERFHVIASPPRGLVPALNEGLGACRGEVVARMDADDLAHRHRLREQLRALDADAALAGVGTHVRIFPRHDGMRKYESWLNGIVGVDDVRREAFVECPIAHPTLAVRRAVLARHGYRDAGWAEDYDLVLRMLAAGERLAVVPRRLLLWRDGPNRTSRTDPRYGLDRFTACRASFLARGPLGDADRYVLWGYGPTARKLARALLTHGKRPAAIVEVHRGRVGQQIAGAPVVAPERLGDLRGFYVVASVANAVARGRIRAALTELGLAEPADFACCA
jgi:glycosyltransferase involved in cell wall biosynthesis